MSKDNLRESLGWVAKTGGYSAWGDFHIHTQDFSVDGRDELEKMVAAQAVMGAILREGAQVPDALGLVVFTEHDNVRGYEKDKYNESLENGREGMVGLPKDQAAVEITTRYRGHLPHILAVGQLGMLAELTDRYRYFDWVNRENGERPTMKTINGFKYPARTKMFAVMARVADQESFTIAPHVENSKPKITSLRPGDVEDLQKKGIGFNAIEIFNSAPHSLKSTLAYLKNVRTRVRLAMKYGLGVVGSSDAHGVGRVGAAFTQFRYAPSDFWEALEMIERREARPVCPSLGEWQNRWVWKKLKVNWD